MPITDRRIANDDEDQAVAEDLPPALPIGFVLGGKYHIKRVLGIGGNGAVYESEHSDIGHRVAIKVAHHKLDDRGDVMTRFRREARICGSLRHPHVGQVFDVGTLDNGAPYMVMELQEGRSLADAIDETTLPIAAIIHISRQLLAGLSAVHQARAVHLDVKPDNVMLVRDHGGEVVLKLVDFGISKRLNETETDPAAVEDEDFIIGSPDYMPPEQLRGEAVDARTDLYAAGVLIYEALTGHPPFDGDSTNTLIASIMKDPVPPPGGERPDCPAELERIVLKALSRAPDERWQSADEMSRALAEVRTGSRTSATATGGLSPLTASPAMPRRATTVRRRRRTVNARALHTLRLPRAKSGQVIRTSIELDPKAKAHTKRIIASGVVGILCALGLGTWLSVRSSSPQPAADVTVSTIRQAAPTAPIAQAPSAPVVAAPIVATAAILQPPPTAAVVKAEIPSAPAEPVKVEPAPVVAVAPVETKSSTSSHSSKTHASRSTPARAPARVTAPAAPQVKAAPPPPAVPEQDPALTRSQLKAATSAFQHGQVSQALGMFKAITQVAPREAAAWRGVAVAANQLGARADAERALRRYFQLRPAASRDPSRILTKLEGVP